jgi:uncharacterized protein
MRNLSPLAASVFVLGLCMPAAAEPLAGDWIGQIDFESNWQRVYLHISADKEIIKGTIDFPQQGRQKLSMRSVSRNAANVHMEFQDKLALATFDGKLSGDTLAGEYIQGAVKAGFHLVRAASAQSDLKLCGEYAGSYKLGPDRFVDLAPFSEDEDRPIFFDSKTRRTGVLYATSATEFFSGPSYGVMFPIDIRVTFLRNERGEVSGLKWQEGSAQPINAERVGAYTQEEISFHNGDVLLRGTLTLPATKGPHPVVIQVHGSGPERRPGGHWTHFFARHGIGYLYFDKRGAGASTGDWSKATFDDLAGDVLAAVAALRKHKNVSSQHVCLWGNSNGGWVAPLAAARSADVAFLIVRSGSGLSVHENILYELEMDLRGAGGFSADDIAQARAIRKKLNAALLTNSGWEALKGDVDRAKQEKWFQYARVQWLPLIPPPLDSSKNPYLKGLRAQIDFDPAATWEKVKCPVLVLLGELDANVPSKVSAAIMERGLKKAGNKDYTIRILPKANHGLLEAVTGDSAESPRLTKYVSGYMDGMVDWLLKHVDTKPAQNSNK